MSDVPDSTAAIQIEGLQSNAPASESAMQSIGGLLNYLLKRVTPVGSIQDSVLTEAQFQSETGTNWILADGRNVAGSRYSTVTGFTNVPDLRGVFRRGKNNGRADGRQNTYGEELLTAFEFDGPGQHIHRWQKHTSVGGGLSHEQPYRDANILDSYAEGAAIGIGQVGIQAVNGTGLGVLALTRSSGDKSLYTSYAIAGDTYDIDPTAGGGQQPYTETTVRSVTVNVFIRIN